LDVLISNGVNPVSLETVIPPHVIKEVTTPRSIVSGDSRKEFSPSLYSLGWVSSFYRGHKRIWHTGGLPGFFTWTGFLPNDGLGIFIVANTITPGTAAAQEKIALLLTDTVLGLESLPSRTEETARTTKKSNDDLGVHRDVSLEPYEGLYYNPAYGSVVFCYLQSKSTSSICDSTRATFASVNITEGLAAGWGKVWFKNLIAEPIGEEMCVEGLNLNLQIFRNLSSSPRCIQPVQITALSIYPDGYGKDTSAFSIYRADHFYAAFLKMDDNIMALAVLDGVEKNVFEGNSSISEMFEHTSVVLMR